jgi:ribosomal protein S18 acetylase RimI-like enzyme
MIRFAEKKDIKRIGELLLEVDLVHHNARPDIFKVGRKYSDAELSRIIKDKSRPILVYTDESDTVLGYCFCVIFKNRADSILTDIKTLYIDDLCVDSKRRREGIGRALYAAALSLAKESGCYNLTLNVWSCNPDAVRFYESLGLTPQKINMELII